MKSKLQEILIIGYGKLGTHLYHAVKKSSKFKISVIKNKTAGRNTYFENIKNAGIIFICVQDSLIVKTAGKIKGLKIDLKNKIIFHTSGALTSDILIKLSEAGAETASFHPVQTFAAKTPRYSSLFSNIYIAIEGSEKAIKAGVKIAKSIGSLPYSIKKKDKALHHICCVIASNFLTVLASKIEEIPGKKIRINGFNQNRFLNIYIPLAKQTIENISAKGSRYALTGPIARNDIKTIEKHLFELSKTDCKLMMFYILTGIETIKLALNKKSINNYQAKQLYKLFSNYTIKQ